MNFAEVFFVILFALIAFFFVYNFQYLIQKKCFFKRIFGRFFTQINLDDDEEKVAKAKPNEIKREYVASQTNEARQPAVNNQLVKKRSLIRTCNPGYQNEPVEFDKNNQLPMLKIMTNELNSVMNSFNKKLYNPTPLREPGRLSPSEFEKRKILNDLECPTNSPPLPPNYFEENKVSERKSPIVIQSQIEVQNESDVQNRLPKVDVDDAKKSIDKSESKNGADKAHTTKIDSIPCKLKHNISKPIEPPPSKPNEIDYEKKWSLNSVTQSQPLSSCGTIINNDAKNSTKYESAQSSTRIKSDELNESVSCYEKQTVKGLKSSHLMTKLESIHGSKSTTNTSETLRSSMDLSDLQTDNYSLMTIGSYTFRNLPTDPSTITEWSTQTPPENIGAKSKITSTDNFTNTLSVSDHDNKHHTALTKRISEDVYKVSLAEINAMIESKARERSLQSNPKVSGFNSINS